MNGFNYEVRQSQLNQFGIVQDFPKLDWRNRRNLAIWIFLHTGRTSEAQFLEMNNPLAIAKVTYVQDAPKP